MGTPTKIAIVLLNFIIFNAANIYLNISNFSKRTKILLLILGNAIILGGSIYIIMASGV